MGKESKIQWTQGTWNPWYGCIKVGEGCKNCYMYRDMDRWNKNPRDIQRSKTKFNDPLKWDEPQLIFTCSLSDFFIEEADSWRAEVWNIIKKTPQHFYQILTKRPERIEKWLPTVLDNPPYFDLPENCIYMLSVSTQKEFDTQWPIMESLKRHYRIKIGLSIEPILEQISIEDWLHDDYDHTCALPDWVIVGGESGHKTGKYKRRDCDLAWLNIICQQCAEFEVPVFLKQLGSALASQYSLKHPHGGDPTEWFFAPLAKDHLLQFPDFMTKYLKP